MLDCKKGVAQKIVYGAFTRVEEKTEKPALEVFEAAMNNVMPVLAVSYTHLDVYKRQVHCRYQPDAIRSRTEAQHHPLHRRRRQRRQVHGVNALPLL